MKSPQLVRLNEVASFLGGGTPLRERAEYFGGGIPWVKTTDLNNGAVNTTEETLTAIGLKKSSCQMIPSNAVLVAMYGGFKQIGRTGLLVQSAAINQALTAIIPDAEKLDSRFLLEWLNHRVGYWKRFAGSSRKDPNITKTDVADFPVPLFPICYQKKSIALLAEWDVAIQKATALLAALEQRKQGLMQQLLTGRRRLKGFKGKWKMTRADKLFDDIAKRSQLNEQLLSVTQDRGVIPRTMLVGRVTMPSGDVNSFKLVEPDNFVISLRSFQGGLEHSAYRGLVSPAYTVLEADTAQVHAPYFRQYFKSVDFLHRLSVAVVGIRDGKQISYTDFKSIKLPLPPLPEQQAIAALLTFADSEITLAAQRAEQLRTQKRALMQKLLSGDWRMPKTAKTAILKGKNV